MINKHVGGQQNSPKKELKVTRDGLREAKFEDCSRLVHSELVYSKPIVGDLDCSISDGWDQTVLDVDQTLEHFTSPKKKALKLNLPFNLDQDLSLNQTMPLRFNKVKSGLEEGLATESPGRFSFQSYPTNLKLNRQFDKDYPDNLRTTDKATDTIQIFDKTKPKDKSQDVQKVTSQAVARKSIQERTMLTINEAFKKETR